MNSANSIVDDARSLDSQEENIDYIYNKKAKKKVDHHFLFLDDDDDFTNFSK